MFYSGKILGLQANYIIAEVEFHEGEDPLDLQEDDGEKLADQVVSFCFIF